MRDGSVSSASMSSMVGKLDPSSRGKERVSSYSEMPIGLVMPLKAYSATTRLRSCQRIKPMDAASVG